MSSDFTKGFPSLDFLENIGEKMASDLKLNSEFLKKVDTLIDEKDSDKIMSIAHSCNSSNSSQNEIDLILSMLDVKFRVKYHGDQMHVLNHEVEITKALLEENKEGAFLTSQQILMLENLIAQDMVSYVSHCSNHEYLRGIVIPGLFFHEHIKPLTVFIKKICWENEIEVAVLKQARLVSSFIYNAKNLTLTHLN